MHDICFMWFHLEVVELMWRANSLVSHKRTHEAMLFSNVCALMANQDVLTGKELLVSNGKA